MRNWLKMYVTLLQNSIENLHLLPAKAVTQIFVFRDFLFPKLQQKSSKILKSFAACFLFLGCDISPSSIMYSSFYPAHTGVTLC